MSIAKRAITKLLTSPSKVAHSLDWRKASGAILSVNISPGRIGLAVASHPVFEQPCESIAPILLESQVKGKKKVLQRTVAEELRGVINDYKVCGIVVSWPLQKEGWCGMACGRVLNVLDQISLNDKIKVCLYDSEHHSAPEDEWGRSVIYSIPSNKTFYMASLEQYDDDLSKKVDAADVWKSFCKEHWPDIPCNFEDNESGEGSPIIEGFDSWLASTTETRSLSRAAA